jgi:hypothetical protein
MAVCMKSAGAVCHTEKIPVFIVLYYEEKGNARGMLLI